MSVTNLVVCWTCGHGRKGPEMNSKRRSLPALDVHWFFHGQNLEYTNALSKRS